MNRILNIVFLNYVITITPVNERSEYKFHFFITESNLLKSIISVREHQTGEISRSVLSKICIEKELAHFGIKLMETEEYIGNNKASIIEITPMTPVNSMLAFFRRVEPIMDLILLITSFAEGRRLNWYKCEGYIGTNFVEIYNSRVTFYNDNRATTMKNEQFFKVFLKHSLQNIEVDDVQFISKTFKSYLSAKDFTAEASIVLWFSLLEKILKHNFGSIKKKNKEDLLRKLGVHLSDYPPMTEMIKIRAKIAHGDDLDSDKVFRMYLYWEKLINETLYAILKWDRSIEMQVYVDEQWEKSLRQEAAKED